MKKYLAIVHHDEGSAYGVWFPDLPGCYGEGIRKTKPSAVLKSHYFYMQRMTRMTGRKCLNLALISELRKDPDVLSSLEESDAFFVSVPLLMNSGRTRET